VLRNIEGEETLYSAMENEGASVGEIAGRVRGMCRSVSKAGVQAAIERQKGETDDYKSVLGR